MEIILLVLGGILLFAAGIYTGFQVGAWQTAAVVLRELEKGRSRIPDEPLLSPKRLWFAVCLWVFWKRNKVNVPLLSSLRYHHRPLAAHRDGVY